MSRRARSSQTPDEATDVTLGPRAVWGSLIAAIVILAGIGVWRLELRNRTMQTERRLNEHPRYQTWYTQMESEVRQRQQPPIPEGTPRLAHEIWHGRVSRVDLTTKGKPEEVIMELAGARLLAGPPGVKQSTGALVISILNHRFSERPPQKGDTWVVAIWRDVDGRAFIRDGVIFY